MAHTHGPDCGLRLMKLSLVVGVRKMKTLSLTVGRVQSLCLFRPSCVPKEKNEGCSSPGTRPPCSFSFSPSEVSVRAASVFHRPLRHSCQQPFNHKNPHHLLFKKPVPRCTLANQSQFQKPQLSQHAESTNLSKIPALQYAAGWPEEAVFTVLYRSRWARTEVLWQKHTFQI